MGSIYLDYNATTPIAPEVREAMLPFLTEHYGNPSSNHTLGKESRAAVEAARADVALLLGAAPDEIVFTSGGTESNNLALKGVAWQSGRKNGHLVISALEHPAVVEPARFLERQGYHLSVVGCTHQGIVEPSSVEARIRPDTVLVSIMHANNEIGTIQPLREIADLCRRRGVLVHTDAAQSVGKIPVRVDALGVDLLTVAGHKLYAPKGVGALYVRRGTPLEPLLHGAGHERGLRAGTENVAYIVGLGRAARLIHERLGETTQQMAQLGDRLYARLRQRLGERLVLHGHPTARLPNTLSISILGTNAHELLDKVPKLCASTGAACHSGRIQRSATLTALGATLEQARGTLRLSLGWYTTEEEVDRAAELLLGAANRE